jgi:putative transposase
VEAIVSEQIGSKAQVCKVLAVSRSAFHVWQKRIPTQHELEDALLCPMISRIFHKHRRRYGTRRIVSDLQELKYECSRRRVGRLMKTLGLRAIQPNSFVPKTTQSRHRLGYSPNLLADDPEVTDINQVWVGDITYVGLKGGQFCYLAVLMDRYSRMIVGWHLDDHMEESLVKTALQMSIRNRAVQDGLIHHTDRGGQYAATLYRATLRRAGMRQSMNRPDNCYDNAFMESCFGTIKTEMEMTEYEDRTTALNEVRSYVTYYNFERKHSRLGYLAPATFESQLNQPE